MRNLRTHASLILRMKKQMDMIPSKTGKRKLKNVPNGPCYEMLVRHSFEEKFQGKATYDAIPFQWTLYSTFPFRVLTPTTLSGSMTSAGSFRS